MAPRKDDRPWAIYARLSQKKKAGKWVRAEDESTERQVRESRAFAAEEGIEVGDDLIFVDPHMSAWKASRERPAWDAMMAEAREGRLGGIIVWRVDRFARRSRDGLELLDVAEKHHVVIDGPMSGRFNLRTANGRKQFRDAVNAAEYESDTTSERIKSAMKAAREAGAVIGGPRIFGFAEAGSPAHHPTEAAVVREAAARILAGESVSALCRDFTQRGITSVNDRPFSPTVLATMLGRPRYGGWVEHLGEVVARMPGDPILDTETYDALQALLASRRRGRRATDRFPLTSAITCGRDGCGRTMAGAMATKNRAKGTTNRLYRCPSHAGGCGQAIKAEPVEDLVRDEVLARLADPSLRARIGERDAALGDARLKADQDVETIEDQLVGLEVKRASGEIIERAYQASKTVLDRRHKVALAARQSLAVPAGGGPLPEVTREDWDEMTGPEKRQVLRSLNMTVTVMPVLADAPHRSVDLRRVVIA